MNIFLYCLKENKKNYDKLVELDLLMPKFLASLNVSKVASKLRDAYLARPDLPDI